MECGDQTLKLFALTVGAPRSDALLTRTIQDVTVVRLGMLAGAMLLIAAASVGYWTVARTRSLSGLAVGMRKGQ